MSNRTELYDVLGLKQDASDTEIRAAYKVLAKKYHPDKNKEPGAEEMFKKVNQANAILSDPEKKKVYDQFGMEGFEAGMGMGEGMDPFDIFNMMHRQQQQRKPMAQLNHSITLEEYFTKKVITVTIPRKVRCEPCDATGFADKQTHKCKQCKGAGMVMQTIRQGPIIQQIQTPCPVCRGQKIDTTGQSGPKCKECNGQGTIMINEDTEVKVPSNIVVDATTIVKEKGPFVDDVYIDLAVVFKLKMPKDFGMTSDRKLIYTMHINYTETLCGFKRILNHPSGKKILIISERGYIINPYLIYLLERLGFDNDSMYLSFVIHYPETITLPKKKNLTFEALELAIGERRVPNASSDSNIDPEDVYTLSTLTKINNDPRSKEADNDTSGGEDDEDDHHGPQGHGMPGSCAQQ